MTKTLSLAEIARSGKTFIVAEIAQAHDGSLGILHSLIDASAQAGVDAVKFQVHIAAAESSAVEPFRTKFSYVDKTRYDYWQRMEFSLEHCGIHCQRRARRVFVVLVQPNRSFGNLMVRMDPVILSRRS